MNILTLQKRIDSTLARIKKLYAEIEVLQNQVDQDIQDLHDMIYGSPRTPRSRSRTTSETLVPSKSLNLGRIVSNNNSNVASSKRRRK
ncbi:MAG: hypothetical protein ACO35C_05240 [Pontimonas sp.]